MVEATKENFRDLVAEGVTLVDVWGPDCAPCIAMMPDIERMEAERDELQVIKIEAPKNRRLCIELRVMGLPHFLLFHDGEELDRIGGDGVTASQLRKWVDDQMSELATERS
ncbi:MAG: thioredoxin family protein [Acidimicrobiales bacterium]